MAGMPCVSRSWEVVVLVVQHVLVVDDDALIREVLHLLLEDAGHEVLEARDGQEALDCLRSTPHRLVTLLDLQMPVLDGLAVLKTVAQDRQLASRHAYILITAYPDQLFSDSLSTLITSQLAVPFIPKPFDVDTVLTKVSTAACRLR
jgi:CheY-like chemotaxis protein